MIKGKTRYPGPGGMFALSLVFHLLALVLLVKVQLVPTPAPEQAPVYVDVVTLPVASPQEGTPAPSQAPAAAAEPAPREPAPMALPQPKAPRAAARVPAPQPTQKKAPAPRAPGKAPAPPQPSSDDGRSAVEDHLAKLQAAADARRQNDVLDRLRKKTSGGGKVGMPGAKGTEAGSDYNSYIQSRLADALQATIAVDSDTPLVILKISVGSDGHLAGYHLLQSSGDRVFEDAVDRAVKLAARSFRPPPNGKEYQNTFRFYPKSKGFRAQ